MTDNTHDVWLKTDADKLKSLIADEAKMVPMLENMGQTIRQLKSKQQFRLALLNQVLESLTGDTKYNNNNS
tara:strand:- start:4011 stop:4223 length:213 start_codon:yes stop_codon:yes gene_type:complete